MTTLLSFAQKLAQTPPTDVFQQVMTSYAKSVDDKDMAKSIAEAWSEQVKRYTLEGATYSVGAICDLTAMCMMTIAAGVKRIETLKAQIEAAATSNKSGMVFENKLAGDRAYFLKGKAGHKDFKALLENWTGLEGNGVIQFKFPAAGDWHTFVIERLKEQGKDAQFLVYQSYQNTYRLLDFLGLGTTEERTAQMKRVWTAHPLTNEYGTLENFIKESLERIRQTRRCIGLGGPLGKDFLEQYVLAPLKEMMIGAIPNDTYVLLTASSTVKQSISTSFMGVIVCDQVTPSEFSANYNELRSSKDLTIYPTFPAV